MKKPRAPRAARKTAPPSGRVPGYDDILAIARLIESGSRFTEFRLRSGDIEVEVKREGGASGAAAAAAGAAPDLAAPAHAGARFPDLPPGTHLIRSPMVGTFYRAPEPGAKPFVEAGTKVRPDSIVCIIEVMKLMNSVPAGVAGVVTHVLAQNAQAVEAGQAVIAIKPE